jgi:hypothetical protein
MNIQFGASCCNLAFGQKLQAPQAAPVQIPAPAVVDSFQKQSAAAPKPAVTFSGSCCG